MPKSHYYKQSIVSDLHKRLEDTSRFLNEQTETVKETNELGKRMKSETDNISKKLKDQQTELKKKKEFAKKKQEEVKKLSNEISGLSKTIQRINDRFLSFSKDLGKDLENAKKKLDQEITKANTLVTEITSVLGDVGAADLLKELVLKIDDAANQVQQTQNNLKEGENQAETLNNEIEASQEGQSSNPPPVPPRPVKQRIRRRSYTKRRSMRRKSRSMKRKSRSYKRKSRSMKRRSYKKRSMSRRRRY
jgi:uncharacterized phage infection (PIP) family protein YhgE